METMVATAVHELAHVLVFSSAHFRKFRNADGTPMLPREANDLEAFQGEVYYTCSSTSYQWGVAAQDGDFRYVDMSPRILTSSSERGFLI